MTADWTEELTRLAGIVQGLGQEHLELKCAVTLGICMCTAFIRGAVALERIALAKTTEAKMGAAAAINAVELEQRRAAQMVGELRQCASRDEMLGVLARWGR